MKRRKWHFKWGVNQCWHKNKVTLPSGQGSVKRQKLYQWLEQKKFNMQSCITKKKQTLNYHGDGRCKKSQNQMNQKQGLEFLKPRQRALCSWNSDLWGWGAAAGTEVSKLQVGSHGLGPRELRGSASQRMPGSLQVWDTPNWDGPAAHYRKALPARRKQVARVSLKERGRRQEASSPFTSPFNAPLGKAQQGAGFRVQTGRC